MEKLFELTQIQTEDIPMGDTCDGNVLLVPTCGGSFSGEKLNGNLLPVVMGTAYSRTPGQHDIAASMLLETEDGARIIMEFKAYFDVDAAVEEKMESGELVDPSEYYYKGTAVFKTDDERYKWLERKICTTETEILSWEELVTNVYLV